MDKRFASRKFLLAAVAFVVGVVSGYLYARHDPFRLAIIVRRRE